MPIILEVQGLINNDAITLGILMVILAIIFKTSNSPRFAGFYKYVPALLLCYFVPAILNSLGLFSTGSSDRLYYVASRFLLPASLVLLCLNIDMKGVLKLGPKALIMFFTATASIIIGGPIALFIMGQFELRCN